MLLHRKHSPSTLLGDTMFRRFTGWILDLIAGERELTVEPHNHPYYPGEGDL